MATTRQTKIRNKLKTKVFDRLGKNVTLKSKNTPTYNDRGEEESVTYSSSTIKIVPYNIFSHRETYEAFGTMSEGDMDAAVPYDVTINRGDIVEVESEDYEVKEIQPNYLPGNVVTIIRLSRVQP